MAKQRHIEKAEGRGYQRAFVNGRLWPSPFRRPAYSNAWHRGMVCGLADLDEQRANHEPKSSDYLLRPLPSAVAQ